MKRFLILLLMAVPAIGISQSNFQKGYVVTQTKDTLNGYIDHKEEFKNPNSFIFKTTLNSVARTFTLKDCLAVSIDDRASYQRFLVDISLGSVDLSKISAVVDTTSRREAVFLQVLQTGPNLTLYSYVDGIKSRFYILDREEIVPTELVMQRYYKSEDEPGKLMTNLKYARQLSYLMKKYNKSSPVNESRLATLNYTKEEMIKVVVLINGQQKPKSKFEQSRWFVGLSLDLANTKFRGSSPLAVTDAKSKMFAAPMFSAGVDLFVNPAVRKLVFRTELAFIMSKSELTSSAGGNSFDQLSAILTPSLLYHIHNADQFKVFVSIGTGLNYSKTSNLVNFKYEKELLSDDLKKVDLPLELKKFYLTFPINAGVVLNKRIELLAGYSVPTSMTDYANFNAERQRFRLGLNYLFGKH